MPLTALFVEARAWKPLECLSAGEWMARQVTHPIAVTLKQGRTGQVIEPMLGVHPKRRMPREGAKS